MAAELLPRSDYIYRIYQMRYFWWSLVVNDLQNRYRHSFFGIAWSLGRPIFMTVVLCVIFGAALGEPSPYEYAPFVFLSVALWQFLTETVNAGCNAFFAGRAFIRQQPLPLAIFPLRTVLGTSIHAGLALLVALLLISALKGVPSPLMVLAAVPGLLLLLLAAVALTAIFGIMHTYFPDTQHLVEIVWQALFYITPVMYRADALKNRPRVSLFIHWNPLTALLESVRAPLLQAELPSAFYLLYAGLFVLGVGSVAWWCLRRVENSLVYWLV